MGPADEELSEGCRSFSDPGLDFGAEAISCRFEIGVNRFVYAKISDNALRVVHVHGESERSSILVERPLSRIGKNIPVNVETTKRIWPLGGCFRGEDPTKENAHNKKRQTIFHLSDSFSEWI